MTQPADDRPAIAAAVIVHDGRFLLVQRNVAEGSLSWQFPAGEVEDGESYEDAAIRETAEEAGLTVVAKSVLGERVHPATGRLMIYVECERVAGDAALIAPDEISGIAWCRIDQLPAFVPHGIYEPVQKHLSRVLS